MERIETATIEVSIVVPTYNRRCSLQQTLFAVAQQDYPVTRFEVIVVADGCNDGTVELLQRLQSTLPYRLRWIVQEQSGPAAARNAAIAAADGAIIAFLDDDVVPVAGWLSTHMAHHSTDDRAVVIGPLSPGGDSRPAWVRWEDDSLQQQYRAMLSGVFRPTPRQFYTGNSSARRAWILRAGGFDIRLRRAEDVELAFRLQDLGLHFYFDPQAEGRHRSFRTYRSWQGIPRQYGHNDVVMGRDQGRVQLLFAAGQEFHRRRRGTRILARLCVGHPSLFNLTIGALGLVARSANRFDKYPASAAACSAIWNLAYWQGLCESLGGKTAFWQLVGSQAS